MVWLDNARLFAIFAVVVVHVSYGVPWHAEEGSLLWAYGLSWGILVRWCVPVFVMISGALLLGPHEKESLGTFYKKRFSRILIPILFWSLLYIVWGYFRENVQEPFTASYVLEKLASGKPYYHLWFMYMLLGLYAFTPVFRAIVAKLETKELVFFTGLSFAIATIQSFYEAWYVGESNLFLTWFLTYTPFYFAGYLVQLYKPTGSPARYGLVALAVAASVAGSAIWLASQGSQGAGVFFKNLSPSNILVSLSLVLFFRSLNKPLLGEKLTANIAKLTFGIYLLHMIPLAYLYDAKDLWSSLSPYLYTPVFSLVCLVVTAVLVAAMGRVPYLRRVF
ncbi:MAG: acyltransferase family protein [Alphaproteobacteria bacterium]|nr:acyltransferase family protein [Alphaproteobacteria bacterium]